MVEVCNAVGDGYVHWGADCLRMDRCDVEAVIKVIIMCVKN